MADIFRQTASKHPQKAAFIFEQKTWTFQDVEDYSNRIANYFKSQGFEKGDTIALFLESCPEFVCIWLGLSKLGVITALINTNLRHDSLWHCISVADCKAIIFGCDLSGNMLLCMYVHPCTLPHSYETDCVPIVIPGDWGGSGHQPKGLIQVSV